MGPLPDAQQESFAQAVFSGSTMTQAYMLAFSETDKVNAGKRGSELGKIPEIQNRLKELRSADDAAFVLTRDWVVAQMADTAVQAEIDRDHNARRGALKELGREVNAFTERQEVMVRSFKDMDQKQIEEFLASERAQGIAPATGERGGGGTGKTKGRDKKPRAPRSLAG